MELTVTDRSGPYRRDNNSTSYVHPNEENLTNLHKAMDYTENGEPAFRVLSNIQGDIVIEGNVNIPGSISIDNFPDMQTVDGSVSITGTPTVNIGTIPEVEIKNDVGNPIPVTGTLDIDSAGVSYLDSANLSAFGRLRAANTRLLGEFRNMYGTMGPVEIVTLFENGGNQTVNLAETHTLITVTTDNGSRALRQSRRYHSYIPGTTNLAFISFTLSEAKENLQQSVGLFDDSNGIFFRMNGTTPEMVIRKAGVDSEVVSQDQWNVDRFDGTGPSAINIDFTKSQIFICDYQWLGVGRVRVGFVLNGQIYYTHYFTHANSITEPYMFQPSLPVRWEIKNTGTTISNSSLMCICYGVYVEGSEVDTGFDNSVSNGAGSVRLGAGADSVKGILAVRLKNTVNGQPNRAIALLKDWEVVTNLTANYRVMILQSSADIAGTPTWLPATPTGWCEYTTNFSLTDPPTPDRAVILFDGYATGGAGNRGSSTFVSTDNRSASIYQNYDSSDSMIFAVVGYRIPNDNAQMRASLNWVEIK